MWKEVYGLTEPSFQSSFLHVLAVCSWGISAVILNPFFLTKKVETVTVILKVVVTVCEMPTPLLT